MTQVQKTHSMIGIAACVAGLLMFVSFLLGVLYLRLSERAGSQGLWVPSEAFNLWQIIVVMFLPIPVHLLGVVLGLVSLFFPRRKILFPILAIILNSLFALCSLIPWVWLLLHTPGVK